MSVNADLLEYFPSIDLLKEIYAQLSLFDSFLSLD